MPEIRTSSGQEEIGVAGSRLREGQAAAPSLMEAERAPLLERLLGAGVDRRAFLSYCAGITVALALPPRFAPRVAEALAKVDRPSLVWLEFQDCAGNTESFLRSRNPSVAELVLGMLSIDYQETIMAAAGHDAAAAPDPTGAVGVPDLVSGVPVLNLPGCPVNADNLTATLAHYLTFGELPAADDLGRPLFAYGERIHDACPRRGHFDAGQFALEWGDEGHRKGWCLYKLGCKGPSTSHNCPSVQWNGSTNWPIGAGHPCVGCSEPFFWDTMTPFYGRLPKLPGLGVETSAERVGLTIVAATAAGFGAHGVGKAIQHRVARSRDDRHADADGAEASQPASPQEDEG